MESHHPGGCRQDRTPMGRFAREHGSGRPGLVSKDGLSIAHMPGRLQGLEGLQWQEVLGHKRPIPVINDAHAALLGESRHGAAKGMEQVIMITLGTGVGGAVMVDGHLLKGYLGRAGHLGHLSLDVDGPQTSAARREAWSGPSAMPPSLSDRRDVFIPRWH